MGKFRPVDLDNSFQRGGGGPELLMLRFVGRFDAVDFFLLLCDTDD